MLVDEAGQFISQRTHPKMATIQTHLDQLGLTIGYNNQFFKISRNNSLKRIVQVQIWNDKVDAALEPDLYSQAKTIIPGSFTTATGALVSFDSAGGKVTLVAPFSSSKRSVNKTGALAYTGHFLGVWNAAGKNLAPNGASSIEVDPMKGTLLHYN